MKIFAQTLILFFFTVTSGWGEGIPAGDLPPDEHSSSGYRERWNKVFSAPYEDWFRFHGSPHMVDPYIWVFSKEFADRFRMPSEWVDPTLKGALALAWRMTSIGYTSCGFGGNPESCWAPLTCQLDVYYDNRIELPWTHPEVMRENVRLGLDSSLFLGKSPGSKQRRYILLHERILAPVSRMSLKEKVGVGGQPESFDREIELGTGLITWAGPTACPTGLDENRTAYIFFSPAGSVQIDPQKSIHTIEIPAGYVAQIMRAYEIGNKPNNERNQDMVNNALKAVKH